MLTYPAAPSDSSPADLLVTRSIHSTTGTDGHTQRLILNPNWTGAYDVSLPHHRSLLMKLTVYGDIRTQQLWKQRKRHGKQLGPRQHGKRSGRPKSRGCLRRRRTD